MTAEEANIQIDRLDRLPEPETAKEKASEIQELEQIIAEEGLDPVRKQHLEVFIRECAAANSPRGKAPVTAAAIKVRAAKNFDRC